MRTLLISWFLTFSLSTCFSLDLSPEEELVLSTPEELGTLSQSSLIKGIISPLSGAPSLKELDLLVRGAQEIRLERIYSSPHIPYPLHNKEKQWKNWDIYSLHKFLSKNYKGWRFFPQLYLQFDPQSGIVRTTNSNGITLDFRISKPKTMLISDPYGMSNCSGDIPSGKNDPRNTNILIEKGGAQIIVKSPDGTHRIYGVRQRLEAIHYYQLEKEILPNGKIIRYQFDYGKLTCVESLSPDECIVYARLYLEGIPCYGKCTFTSSSSDNVTYHFEQRPTNVEVKDGHHTRKIGTPFPPILTQVNSPFYRNETLKYSNKFLLDYVDGKNKLFQCKYGVFGRNDSKHYKLEKLKLPVGVESAFQDVCSIRYHPPIPGKQEGTTTVHNIDGTQIIYRFTENLLSKAIETFDEYGTLKLQKCYTWMDNGWLKSIEIVDEEGGLFSKKTYDYDEFGNPIRETLIGDLSGSKKQENYVIEREYSLDGRNLLLWEKNEEGKIVFFEYLPNTNLITAKFIQDNDQILIREFYVYDEWNNLIQRITDNGKSKDIHDFHEVSERTWTQITVRQEAPFIHMPEWIEEKYLENGEEKLLKRTHLFYDQWGNICQEDVYDSEGEFAYSACRTFNERGDLLSETNALGQERTFSYDNKGRPLHSTNYSGRLHKSKTYDLKGRLIHENHLGKEENKKTFTYAYDENDHLIKKTDEYENSTHYTYDLTTHRPTACTLPSIESTEGKTLPVTSHFRYDALGREISRLDANSNITQYKYNIRGDKTEILYPNDSKETYRYYKNGKLKKHIDQERLTTTYEYDLLGRLKAKKFYANEQIAEETFTYNAFRLLSETDKEGNIASYTYDGSGRKIKEEKSGRTIEFQYDSLGRLQNTLYTNGNNSLIRHLERDLLDRILSEEKTNVSDDLLYRIAYTYDDDGNKAAIIRYTNNAPHSETFVYDAFGRIKEHKDALEYLTQIAYDDTCINSIGQKVLQKTIVNPKGIQTVETHDAHGRVIKKETQNLQGKTIASKEYIFDPCGNLLLEKDHIYKNTEPQKTQTISYCYNSSHLLQSLTRAFGTSNERTTRYTYTPSGKIASKTLPSQVSLYYGYNLLGYSTSLASSDGTIDHKFERNLLGHLILTSDEVNHIQVKRNVDPFGNILKEQFSTGLSIEKNYDYLDRPLLIKLPDQQSIHYTYDPLYLRSVFWSSPSGATEYSHQCVEYDLSGSLHAENMIGECGSTFHQVDQKGRQTALISPYFKQTLTYDESDNLISIQEDNRTFELAYDDLNQLVEEDDYSYAYDSNYNRTQKNQEIAQLNELNELESLGTLACEYDLNGNLITKKTPNSTMYFSYDALNQLIEVRSENQSTKFNYDPLGRRIAKTIQKPKSFGRTETTKEFYLWDGQEEIGAFDENKTCKNLKVLGSGKPIAIELEKKPYVPILDIQGNIRSLVAPITKTQEAHYRFSAFGEENLAETYLLNPWRYASKRWDTELGLSYFGKRYYDPQIGRWLTPDPMGFVDGTNLYQYLLNNPYGYTDPNGEFIIAIPLLVWGAGAAAPTLAAIGTYIAAGVATGAMAYGGYKLYESYQQGPLADDPYSGYNQDVTATNKNTDVYSPDRPLPRDENGVPIPDTDTSHTQLGTKESRRRPGNNYPQAREFDKNGKPVKDIDFTDHGKPVIHPNPHEHPYEPNSTGGTPQRGDPKSIENWKY